jgi:hypothetical protein
MGLAFERPSQGSEMSRIIPDGLLTGTEAAERLAVALYSGVADREIVKRHRDEGYEVADGKAIEDAFSELWTAVDAGKVQPLAIGPTGKGPLKLSASMTMEIPLLRAPRVGSFNFLRPNNWNFRQFREWFGSPGLSKVTLVFREIEIKRLARTLLRTRRRREASPPGARPRGRPRLQQEVQTVIAEIIQQGKWQPSQSLKTLTAHVNRKGSWPKAVSEDTVGRALDGLFVETRDRRFDRLRREYAPV